MEYFILFYCFKSFFAFEILFIFQNILKKFNKQKEKLSFFSKKEKKGKPQKVGFNISSRTMKTSLVDTSALDL